MVQFKVGPEKQAQLEARMMELGIREEDLLEKFIKGSGPGGQKINKTSSCVYLLHKPSGIEVKCQQTRSQSLNRYLARRELCERIAAKLYAQKTERQQAAEKIRRQKRRRSRRARERMLEGKHARAVIKSGRQRVRGEE